jgi:hypothetical protein
MFHGVTRDDVLSWAGDCRGQENLAQHWLSHSPELGQD